MKVDPNAPFYPCTINNQNHNQVSFEMSKTMLHGGIPIRLAIAAQFGVALLSDGPNESFIEENLKTCKTMEDNQRRCAEIALGYADALITEYNKGK